MTYTIDDLREYYEDSINSAGYVVINGIPYDRAHVLKLVDETAYRSGFNDYCAGFDECDNCENFVDRDELNDGLCDECHNLIVADDVY